MQSANRRFHSTCTGVASIHCHSRCFWCTMRIVVIITVSLLWLGQGRSHPDSKKEKGCMVSGCKKRKWNVQKSPKSELCGFKWANTHNKCVHDLM